MDDVLFKAIDIETKSIDTSQNFMYIIWSSYRGISHVFDHHSCKKSIFDANAEVKRIFYTKNPWVSFLKYYK